jgi:hypothetical protein
MSIGGVPQTLQLCGNLVELRTARYWNQSLSGADPRSERFCQVNPANRPAVANLILRTPINPRARLTGRLVENLLNLNKNNGIHNIIKVIY